MAKYIFVTGGVVSGLGKGITAASLGRLLINRGLKVTVQKLDPYLNVDPGTMNPCEHGEVFVTDDGTETDLDIGHYERFLGRSLNKTSSYTSGKIYSSVISKERKGDYLGKTIQIVPHVTNMIIEKMQSVAHGEDIVIVEIGGTVGDIEGMVYMEALRQFRKRLGPNNSLSIHVTLIPYLKSSGEIKTKPTQASVKELSQMGISADIVVCRTDEDITLDQYTREKIAMFCNLDSPDHVIHNKDCASIYQVPILLKEQKLDDLILQKLKLKAPKDSLSDWKDMVKQMLIKHESTKNIAIVGKYTHVSDSYISVTEAIKHATLANSIGVTIKLVDSEQIQTDGTEKHLANFDAILIPGGFGNRGIEGKILAAQYARENNIPFLGICLGMQIATIEFARNVANITDAHSTEFQSNTKNPVIHIMEDQKYIENLGGTMRLGLYDCTTTPGSKTHRLYGKPLIKERHRHRFEFNNAYKSQLTSAGLLISGINEQNNLVEIIEIPSHPFYVAAQFHPEFLSRPYDPHPLFVGLIKSIIEA